VLAWLGLVHPALGQQRPPTWRRSLRSDVLGCYALYFERRRVNGSLYNATPSVRLDSAAWRPNPRDSTQLGFRIMIGRTMSGVRATVRSGALPPRWSADSLTDTVRLSFIDGFNGAVFVLGAPPGYADVLRGRVFEFRDAGPPHEIARGMAYALREPCRQ